MALDINDINAECHYAECRYAECHYAECRYAECSYAECLGANETNSEVDNRSSRQSLLLSC